MPKSVYIQGIACVSGEADYSRYIPAQSLRRMNKSMKMALYAAYQALEDAGNPTPHAIITGTGRGCPRDSARFLQAILAGDGHPLSPTPFILSTQNMAAATVAQSLGCHGYNMTYTHGTNSFELAVQDALLYLSEHDQETVLLGGVDEGVDGETFPGAEGAAFFVLSVTRQEGTYARINAVETRQKTVIPAAFIASFLDKNGLNLSQIDVVLTGNPDDSALFTAIRHIPYTNHFGEFDTVSAAGLWMAADLMKTQIAPKIGQILIYHHDGAKHHSLLLVSP